MILLRDFKKKILSECGQSMTEFAIILPLVIIFLSLPFDYARLILAKINLNSAATEALSNLKTTDMAPSGTGVRDAIIDSINKSYGTKLDVGRISFDKLTVANSKKEDYTYYVYTSDKANNPFDKQFDERNSNYSCQTVTLKMSLDFVPVTFLGRSILGSSVNVSTREYSRDVYVEGYKP